jgi:hypothetical protein
MATLFVQCEKGVMGTSPPPSRDNAASAWLGYMLEAGRGPSHLSISATFIFERLTV